MFLTISKLREIHTFMHGNGLVFCILVLMNVFDLTGASSTVQETRAERKLQPRSSEPVSQNQRSSEQAAPAPYIFHSSSNHLM
jgi:hypothetical protein